MLDEVSYCESIPYCKNIDVTIVKKIMMKLDISKLQNYERIKKKKKNLVTILFCVQTCPCQWNSNLLNYGYGFAKYGLQIAMHKL